MFLLFLFPQFVCLIVFSGVISFYKFPASTSYAGGFLFRAFGPQLPKGLNKNASPTCGQSVFFF
jgi:hypothetical protein